jgi:hypothetical protein
MRVKRSFKVPKAKPIHSYRKCSVGHESKSMKGGLNLPLLSVPLSCSIMRPSIAVPRASFSQTAWG